MDGSQSRGHRQHHPLSQFRLPNWRVENGPFLAGPKIIAVVSKVVVVRVACLAIYASGSSGWLSHAVTDDTICTYPVICRACPRVYMHIRRALICDPTMGQVVIRFPLLLLSIGEHYSTVLGEAGTLALIY